MRFHVLSLPHTAINKNYCGCAFTQKVLTLCQMLHMYGQEVICYGNEGSRVDCSEFVQILSKDKVLEPSRALEYSDNKENEALFNSTIISEIKERKQKHDFLLCPWPANKVIADVFKDMIVVESGIGYPGGHFAPFKIFESYAVLHAYYGLPAVAYASKFEWYAHVIPNAYDPADFTLSKDKEDYALFLGARHGGHSKGLNVAIDVCKAVGLKLKIAGPDSGVNIPPEVEHLGLLDVERRRHYLSKAKCLLAPSLFLEPFCGAQVEAYFSGTPVISTDWGAFVEYNLHGETGFRCRTHGEFIDSINSLDEIDSNYCHDYAQAIFSIDAVGQKYINYFESVMRCFTGKGWYELNV